MGEMMRASTILMLVAAMLSGCSLIIKNDPLAKTALEYNLEQEESQNALVLLNVARASLYRPKHFSAVTQYRRGSTGDIAAELTAPFGGGSDEKYILKPTLKIPNPTSMDVAPLDSREFVRGIYSPVDLQLVRYFLRQGWPRDLVWTLFVQELRIGRDTYVNDGTDDEFRKQLRQLVKCGLDVVELPIAVSPPLDLAGVDIQKLAAFSNAGFELVPDPTTPTKVIPQRRVHRAIYFARSEKDEPVFKAFEGTPDKGLVPAQQEPQSVRDQIKGCPSATDDAGLTIRSPEGVIFFLGRVCGSACSRSFAVYERTDQEQTRPVLEVKRTSRKPKGAFVAVRYNSQWYFIESDARDYSGTVFGIVSALIGLHKQQQDLPRTGVVQIAPGSL